MAQLRTRKEKERAEQLRLREAADLSSQSTVSYKLSESAPKKDSRSSTLLKVDQQYILKDLVKTISISALLLIVVIGIYFYIRYN